MRLFYFVGGPSAGTEQTFARRLAEVGGPPPRLADPPVRRRQWQGIHLVETDRQGAIDAHLAEFAPGYERGPIVELVRRNGSQGTA